MAFGDRKRDADIEEYRNLMTPPERFEDGFTIRSVIGVFFIAFVMMPSAIYLGLTVGRSMGPAAVWVTIILFADVARRSFKPLKRQELYLLYYAAGSLIAMMGGVALSGGPFASMIWRQYLRTSPAAESFGVAAKIPKWVRILQRPHRADVPPPGLAAAAGVVSSQRHPGPGGLLYRRLCAVPNDV